MATNQQLYMTVLGSLLRQRASEAQQARSFNEQMALQQAGRAEQQRQRGQQAAGRGIEQAAGLELGLAQQQQAQEQTALDRASKERIEREELARGEQEFARRMGLEEAKLAQRQQQFGLELARGLEQDRVRGQFMKAQAAQMRAAANQAKGGAPGSADQSMALKRMWEPVQEALDNLHALKIQKHRGRRVGTDELMQPIYGPSPGIEEDILAQEQHVQQMLKIHNEERAAMGLPPRMLGPEAAQVQAPMEQEPMGPPMSLAPAAQPQPAQAPVAPVEQQPGAASIEDQVSALLLSDIPDQPVPMIQRSPGTMVPKEKEEFEALLGGYPDYMQEILRR